MGGKSLIGSYWDYIDEGLRIIDSSGVIIEVNSAFCKMFEMKKESLVGKPMNVAFVEESPADSFAGIIKLLEAKEILKNYEKDIVLWNGKTHPFEISHQLINDNGMEPVLLSIFKDITQKIKAEIQVLELEKRRLKAEEELRIKSENLRQLIMRIENIKEEENTKIAREIHDELGQALTAIKISLTSLSKNYSNDKDIVEHLFLVNSTIEETIKSMRKISKRLRPRLLDELGLLPAIEWQVREFQTRTGIRCILSSSHDDIKLEPTISTNLFRIFQEALTNISRHSKATNVKIGIIQEPVGILTMDIKDNGVGLPKELSEKSGGLGILGMKERAQILGGGLEIISIDNSGTEVIVNIPINKVSVKYD